MKISVIIPVYNVEKYLKECLDSILIQDFDDYEVIAINDGSTDGSDKILLEYSNKYKNLVVINNVNRGVGHCRNLGVDKSKGEYIYFMDSDDFVDKDFLKEIYKEIENRDYDLLTWGFNFVNEDSSFIATQCKKDIKNIKQLLITDWPVVWNKLFKKSLIEKSNRFFPESLWHQDLGTVPFYIMESCSYKYIPKSFYNYRMVRKGNITHSFGEKSNDIFCILDILKNEAKKNKKYKLELEFLIYYHGKANIRKWKNISNESLYIRKKMKKYLKENEVINIRNILLNNYVLFNKLKIKIKKIINKK